MKQRPETCPRYEAPKSGQKFHGIRDPMRLCVQHRLTKVITVISAVRPFSAWPDSAESCQHGGAQRRFRSYKARKSGRFSTCPLVKWELKAEKKMSGRDHDQDKCTLHCRDNQEKRLDVPAIL